MAIDQVKTINELERLPQVEDSNAFAASTGGATGSVTANQIMEYMKQYLESLSNKSTTLTESDSQYPTCNAVSKETTRITNIMNHAILDTLMDGIWLQTSNRAKFLIQFGYFFSTSTSAEKTVVWPIAFPNHLSNVLTLPHASSGQNFNVNVKEATLSNCVFRTVDGNGYDINISFYWLAAGF